MMWNPKKSVLLSAIFTRIVIALVVCFLFTSPTIVSNYVDYTMKNPEIIKSLLLTIYACSIPGLVALICLDRLLHNIKKEDIFIEKNVKLLRYISWCSFAVSVILVISGFYYILFLMIAVAAAFIGLILRVVKNVIEQAMIIKNENDFTI